MTPKSDKISLDTATGGLSDKVGIDQTIKQNAAMATGQVSINEVVLMAIDTVTDGLFSQTGKAGVV